jgi:hypothetical protein
MKMNNDNEIIQLDSERQGIAKTSSELDQKGSVGHSMPAKEPLTLIDNKNRTEVDAVIEEVKRELRSVFVKTDEQIKRLGNALKKVVKREESICEEIKNALKEEIAEGVISTRTIEIHCPTEWKHKTKPKQGENEKISFSKELKEKPQQQIVATNQGKSVIYGEPAPSTETSRVDDAPFVAIHKSQENDRIESECCSHLQRIEELKEALHKATTLPTANTLLSTNTTSNEAIETLKLEYSLPYQYVQQYMASKYKEGKSKVWFSVEIDVKSKKVASVRMGRISENQINVLN